MTNLSKKNSQHVYDYAIIGSGLSGLCIANAINKLSSNIILLDAGDTFGGLNRSISTPIGTFNNGIRFMPSSETAQKSILFLETLLQMNLQSESVENQSVTFESGGFKPFLGFGNEPPAFYDDINYFLSNTNFKLSLEPHEWSQILFNNLRGDFSPRSYVTKFNSTNDHVDSVTINGQKKVQALNFIYTGPVRSLKNLLPEDALSAKMKAKISKNRYWTGVCMDILHKNIISESTAMHLLNGTTNDDIGPCIGHFLPASISEDETSQFSQWMTFVDSEEAEDTEVIANALKKMKKQLKRAYPESLDNLKFERILVVPDISGSGDLKTSANQTLPSLKNLWIGSSALSKQQNLLGSLQQAELVAAALGCHPTGIQATIQASTNNLLSDTEVVLEL